MLILIAGASGNLGKYLIQHGLDAGHQIRAYGRSPSKLPSTTLPQLESFISCPTYTDPEALSKALSGGVDAVICTYMGHPTGVMDAQLALLRASEAAGVKIYHAHSFTCDWTKISFGDWEHYDAYIAFKRHVELTSTIKPIYTFCGLFAEYALHPLFGVGHIVEEQGEKVLKHYGEGSEKWDFTLMFDAAKHTIDLLTSNSSVRNGEGGFFRIRSGEASAKDLAEAYVLLHKEKIGTQSIGNVGDLKSKIVEAQQTIPLNQYFYYSAYFLQLANVEGVWKMDGAVDVGSQGQANAVARVFDVEQIKGP